MYYHGTCAWFYFVLVLLRFSDPSVFILLEIDYLSPWISKISIFGAFLEDYISLKCTVIFALRDGGACSCSKYSGRKKKEREEFRWLDSLKARGQSATSVALLGLARNRSRDFHFLDRTLSTLSKRNRQLFLRLSLATNPTCTWSTREWISQEE